MTDQNTYPTPSSDVEKAQQAADAIGVTPNSNMRPFVVQAVLYALSRLSPPAQVEVTDEITEELSTVAKRMRLPWMYAPSATTLRDKITNREGGVVAWDVGHEGPFIVQCANAALTATDAKPVVPAEPVAWQHRIRTKRSGVWSEWSEWLPGMADRQHEGTIHEYEDRSLYAAPPSPVEGEVERLRAALKKVRSYNADIAAGRINYRPEDHIQVIEAALASEGKTDA